MLRLLHLEEITDLLLLLPALVLQQEQRSAHFPENAKAWMNSLEKTFTAGRLPQAGSISMLRSGLVAVEQGQMPSALEFAGRPSRSRVLSAAASLALQRASELASNVIAENRPRVMEAERLAQQIVAVALSRGLIPNRDKQVANAEYLQMIRHKLDISNELQHGCIQLEALVGPHDALVFLDRAIAVQGEGSKQK
jgi:hypothetical protein